MTAYKSTKQNRDEERNAILAICLVVGALALLLTATMFLTPPIEQGTQTAYACPPNTPTPTATPTPTCASCAGCSTYSGGCKEWLLDEVYDSAVDAKNDLPWDVSDEFIKEWNQKCTQMGWDPLTGQAKDDAEYHLGVAFAQIGNGLLNYDVFPTTPPKDPGFVPGTFSWELNINLGSLGVDIESGSSWTDVNYGLSTNGFDADWNQGSLDVEWSVGVLGGYLEVGADFDIEVESIGEWSLEFASAYLGWKIEW